jgi:CheY-like chemotaxis protein
MKRPQILLVDDQPAVVQATKAVFNFAGIEVLAATTTSAALETWQGHKHEIDLVVSDYELDGETTGEQLIQLFRADKPDLKSILISAYPLDMKSCGRTEGVDFFQKPWDFKALIAAVNDRVAMPFFPLATSQPQPASNPRASL